MDSNNDAAFGREDALVNYFLNVLADAEDPKSAFLHYFPGEEGVYERLLCERKKLAGQDRERFIAIHGPEEGDQSLRTWLREIGASSAS